MDVHCSKCGEPWDMDTLHDEAAERYGIPFYLPANFNLPAWMRDNRERNPAYDSDAYQRVYQEVRRDFYANGCSALASYGARCAPIANEARVLAANVAYELCGSDVDGAAAMIEDFAA